MRERGREREEGNDKKKVDKRESKCEVRVRSKRN